MRRQHGLRLFAFAHAEQRQNAPDDELHGTHDGRQHTHHRAEEIGGRQRKTIRACDGERLGQHFREDEDQDRHRDGRDDHGMGAERVMQQRCGERRDENVDEGVAEQDRADQAFAVGEERVDVAGAARTFLLELMHEAARNGGQRRFGAGEKSRHQQEQKNASAGEGDVTDHDPCLTMHPLL